MNTSGFPVPHKPTESTQTYVPCIGDAIQSSHPLSSPSPPAFNLSQHQGFFQMSQFFASGGQKYWSFSFSITPSSEYSGLISFRIDRLDLLAVQGTLKSLLQHHSPKASILQCSALFVVQLSHLSHLTGGSVFINPFFLTILKQYILLLFLFEGKCF